MALLDVDEARGVFDHVCEECLSVRRGLKIDPTAGDLTPYTTYNELTGQSETHSLAIRPCPVCRANHKITTESLNARLPGYEAREVDAAPHPDSLEGTVTTLDNGSRTVVTEHHVGHWPHPERVAQAQLIRRLQRHPHLAPHAPVRERQGAQPVTHGPRPPTQKP